MANPLINSGDAVLVAYSLSGQLILSLPVLVYCPQQ